MKICNKCKENKPFDGFYKNSQLKSGLTGWCKECLQKRRPQAKIAEFKYGLKIHGLTIEQYQEILDSQGGVCGICQNPPSTKRRFDIDHDHSCCPGKTSCGKCIRGLLCNKCNNSLENLSPYLEKVREYLGN